MTHEDINYKIKQENPNHDKISQHLTTVALRDEGN